MYEKIAAMVPRNVFKAFNEELVYAGIDIDAKSFVGFVFVLGFAIAIAIGFGLQAFFALNFFIGFFAGFLLVVGGMYYLLNQASEGKGKFVEKILPDALQLIASNMKSGLTTEKALLVSARPEFGPLEIELKEASKKMMAGERTDIALKEMTEKIRSKVFQKTIWLITQGINSGGEMGNLLVQLSEDLREQNALQEEVKGNVSMYVILIFFASVVGAPLMFGISSFIVKIMTKQAGSLTGISEESLSMVSSKSAIGIGSGGAMISPEFILLFSMITLVVISIFGSLTVGIINSRSEKGGIKYIPLMIIASYA
ncbi:type II secretion system F family protein, partial [Candidatus Micrarchaeota archaeon]|nr:type II secretion system F family protein [Candidatus Micrarchaeota archaeon]